MLPMPPMRLDLDNGSNNNNVVPTFVVDTSELVDTAGESGNSIHRLLFASGFSTMLMGLATAFYKPPRGVVFGGHKLAYYLVLTAIVFAGLAEVSTAFYLSRYGRGRTLARAMLIASVVPLLTVAALGGFTVLVK